jgi:Fe2+ transport system protein B
VCDLTRPETLASLSLYSQQIRTINPAAKIVFLGNKLDLNDQRQISNADLDDLSELFHSPYLLTSAKTGEQVENALLTLADLIEQNNE